MEQTPTVDTFSSFQRHRNGNIACFNLDGGYNLLVFIQEGELRRFILTSAINKTRNKNRT